MYLIPISHFSQAQCLEPPHYNDVVEERFIEKLCGWPQCDKHLVNIPSAKYHISVKQKKVLDISERKVVRGK